MKKLTFITLTLLLFAAQANAQMVMEWQSPENITPATLGLEIELTSTSDGARLDFDGDGIPDIPVFNRLQGDDQFGVIAGRQHKILVGRQIRQPEGRQTFSGSTEDHQSTSIRTRRSCRVTRPSAWSSTGSIA